MTSKLSQTKCKDIQNFYQRKQKSACTLLVNLQKLPEVDRLKKNLKCAIFVWSTFFA